MADTSIIPREDRFESSDFEDDSKPAVKIVPLRAIAERDESRPEWMEEPTGLFGDALALIRSSREETPAVKRESMRFELDDWDTSHSVSLACCYQCFESGNSIGKNVREAIIHCLRERKTLVVNYLQRLTRQKRNKFCDDVREIANECGYSLPLYVLALHEGTRSHNTKRGMRYQKNVKGKHCGRPPTDQALVDFVKQHRMFSVRDTVTLSRHAFNVQELPNPLTEGTVKRIRKKLGHKGIQ